LKKSKLEVKIIPVSCTTITAQQSNRFVGPKVWSYLPPFSQLTTVTDQRVYNAEKIY